MKQEENLKDIIVALIGQVHFPLTNNVEELAQNIAKFEKAYYKELEEKE